MPADEQTVLHLITSIESLQGEVKELKESEEERVKAEDRRKSAFRWVVGGTAVAILVGAIGIWAGLTGQATANDVDNALEEFVKERTSRSVIACKQENAGPRQGMLEVAFLIEAEIGPNGRNPDGTLKEDNQRFIDLLKSRFELRDCSPEGVEKYLNELPQ